MQKILLFLFLFSFSLALHSKIHLRNEVIDPKNTQQAHPEQYSIKEYVKQTTSFLGSLFGYTLENVNEHVVQTYLLQLDDDACHQKIQNELNSLGINVGHYIPHNSYIISATPKQVRKAKIVKGIKWIGHMESKNKMPLFEKLSSHLDSHIESVSKLQLKSGNRRLLSKNEMEFIVLAQTAKHDSQRELNIKIQNWDEELKKHLNESFVRLIAVSPQKIAAGVLGKDAALFTTEFLSKKGIVHWVEVKPPTITHNKYAAMLTQSYVSPTSKPLWSRNINGEGQIVGVGDTGLDYYHCFFYDDKNDVPFQRNKRQSIPTSKHRKIAGYWTYMDGKDSPRGHGTHVSGTASGAAHPSLSPDGLSEYNSLAFGSKLAFLDAGCDTDEGCTCPPDTQCGMYKKPKEDNPIIECDIKPNGICPKRFGVVYLPLDLSDGYFPWFYEKGARVVSNSWGTGYYKDFSFGYSTTTSEIDDFAWTYKDFLPVFAAGNSGGQFGYVSLTSESEAKNALVVGASMSSLESFQATTNFTDYTRAVDSIKVDLFRTYCSEDSPSKNDDLCEKAKKFDQNMCCDDTVNGVKQCSVITTKCCGSQLFEEFKGIGFRCCPACIAFEMSQVPSHFSEQNLAHFTARGPTLDGRIKPDVVAIGDYVLSSLSEGTIESKKCDKNRYENENLKMHQLLLKHEGTSMATPVAASAAILIRQFYEQGYYQDGKRNDAVGIKPSAALVKATLIHSAELLNGMIYLMSKHQWWPLQYKPGHKFSLRSPYLQGFGHIELNNVLGEDSGLYVPNKKDATLTTGELHRYCMLVKSSKKKFKITLVWTDPPSSPAAKINLVNDLDLIVIGPDKKLYYGNGPNSVIGLSRTEPDYLNNVEQLEFSGIPPGKYHVIIRGRSVPKGPQPYALVMTGDIDRATQCQEYTELNLSPELQKYVGLTYSLGMLCLLAIPTLCVLAGYYYYQYKQVTESSDGFRRTYLNDTEQALPLNEDVDHYRTIYGNIPEDPN